MRNSSDAEESSRIPRVAGYLRVSTGRQAESDLSIPDQHRQVDEFCAAKRWVLEEVFIEPGATATDDNRPEFQKMVERATDKDHPYDIILVHSYSRFFRDSFGLEMYVRRLRKHDVRLISITQELGDDPAQVMMRQIIGLFDEYQSKETSKHVLRSMKENARQAFYNGSPLPLGYTAVPVEKRGDRVKKKIVVDPVEAELVILIFALYLRGDGSSGPLGIKQLVSYLNDRGYRTRRGAPFGIGSMSQILRNRIYIGEYVFNQREAKTGRWKAPEEHITFAVPSIINEDEFSAVQAKLQLNAPAMSIPRLVNSPILLSGLATCATCGSHMTLRTGTGRNGTVHRYYTCSLQSRYGRTLCKGRSIRMDTLDDLVVEHLSEKLLVIPRVTEIVSKVTERRSDKAAKLDGRLAQLQRETNDADQKLKRLYKMMEEGELEIDDLLKVRVSELRTLRDNAHAALSRAQAQMVTLPELSPAAIDQFVEVMRHNIAEGDPAFRRAYIRSVVQQIEVDDGEVRIIGPNDAIESAVREGNLPRSPVRIFERKWRPLQESNLRQPA